MTKREVISVPFNIEEKPVVRRPERLETTTPLRIGFIGARSTVNALNMERFLKRFSKFEQIYVPPPIEILIAGNVCSNLSAMGANVKLLGHVSSVGSFYDSIDVVVAPMSFSTGIKIKIGEALSYGKPVVATRNGFNGFPPTDEYHDLDDVDAVCRALMKLAFDRARLKVLEGHSALAARLATRRSLGGYEALSRGIRRLSKAIVFVTNQSLWKSDTLEQERLAQWAEYCSHVAHVVIVYTGSDATASFALRHKQLARNSSVVDARGNTDVALGAIVELERTCKIVDIVVSTDDGTGSAIWNGLRGTFDTITLDTWVPELARIACGGAAGSVGDIWIADLRTSKGVPRSLSATALRYLPENLQFWAGPDRSSEILAVLCEPDETDRSSLNLLEAVAGPDRLIVAQTADKAAGQSALLRVLAACRRPGLLLAIGRNPRAVEACRSVAACADIPFLHASSDRMPMAFVARDGTLSLCSSIADLANFLPDLPATIVDGEAEHSRDTGWSSYLRQLSRP